MDSWEMVLWGFLIKREGRVGLGNFGVWRSRGRSLDWRNRRGFGKKEGRESSVRRYRKDNAYRCWGGMQPKI